MHNYNPLRPGSADDELPTDLTPQEPEEEPTEIVASEPKPEPVAAGEIVANGVRYALRPGRNVIGRKAQSSKADIQIPCDTNVMSREHIVIEAKRVPGKGLTHTLSLYKEVKNATSVGSKRLAFGESVELNHGDIIHLPGTDAVFFLPQK